MLNDFWRAELVEDTIQWEQILRESREDPWPLSARAGVKPYMVVAEGHL